MRNYMLLTIFSGLMLSAFTGCDKNEDANQECNSFIQNQSFTARIGETWCMKNSDLELTFGSVLEDSRCNVPQIECVWAGRFVSGLTIHRGDENLQETFTAVNGWRDTLYTGPYAIILEKVIPEARQSMETLPDDKYSLEIIVK